MKPKKPPSFPTALFRTVFADFFLNGFNQFRVLLNRLTAFVHVPKNSRKFLGPTDAENFHGHKMDNFWSAVKVAIGVRGFRF